MDQLSQSLVEHFGLSPEQARKTIAKYQAEAEVRARIRKGRERVAGAAEDMKQDPTAWKQEVEKRLQALDVLRQGVDHLGRLAELLTRVVETEQEMIQKKQSDVSNKQVDWWDFHDSGWAGGGRENFARCVQGILMNLDENRLAGQVINKIGFKRTIPLPEPVSAPQNALELENQLIQEAGRDPGKNPG